MNMRYGKSGDGGLDSAINTAVQCEPAYEVREMDAAHHLGACGDSARLDTEAPVQHARRQSQYSGCHYERLVNSLGGAGLEPLFAQHEMPEPPLRDSAAGAQPSLLDRQCMAALSITYEAGVYGFQGFRCDNLADAVTYAYLRRHTQDSSLSW